VQKVAVDLVVQARRVELGRVSLVDEEVLVERRDLASIVASTGKSLTNRLCDVVYAQEVLLYVDRSIARAGDEQVELS